MGIATIIVLVLIVIYGIYKTISEMEQRLLNRMQTLEQKLRVCEAQLKYGDNWQDKLELEEARLEMKLWEEQLAKAKTKIFGQDSAVKYAEQRLKEAEENYREERKEYGK